MKYLLIGNYKRDQAETCTTQNQCWHFVPFNLFVKIGLEIDSYEKSKKETICIKLRFSFE